jgi:hypothetical protein
MLCYKAVLIKSDKGDILDFMAIVPASLFLYSNLEHGLVYLRAFLPLRLFGQFIGEFCFCPFELKVSFFDVQEGVFESQHMVFCLFLFCLQAVDVGLEYVVLFLGLLHHFLYELNAAVFLHDLRAEWDGSYLSSTVLGMFLNISLYFWCSSVYF